MITSQRIENMPKKPSIKKRVVKVVKRAVKRTLKKEEPKYLTKEEAPKLSQDSVEEALDVLKKNAGQPHALTVETKVATVEETPKPLPFYNGSQVTQILSSGHTKELYHCAAVQGENRITLHVPRSLF